MPEASLDSAVVVEALIGTLFNDVCKINAVGREARN
jgi:hypothetical protein